MPGCLSECMKAVHMSAGTCRNRNDGRLNTSIDTLLLRQHARYLSVGSSSSIDVEKAFSLIRYEKVHACRVGIRKYSWVS